MLGHSAQSIGGALPGAKAEIPQRIKSIATLDSGSGTYTVPASGTLVVYGFAAGGGARTVNINPGAGGGGAFRKSLLVAAGDQISYSVGAPGSGQTSKGGDTSFSAATGVAATAFGGSPGGSGTSTPGGMGGSATGGDVNRRGGDGAPSGSARASDGEFGGVGGSSGNSAGGGGGGAGFSDESIAQVQGGNGGLGGSTAGSAGSPGGGAGAGSAQTGTGGSGRIVFVLIGDALT